MIFTDESYIRSTLKPRKTDAHKGDFGKVLLCAGSPGMAGAAILCGQAALKSGAGLVQYLLPSAESPLLPILQISVPEATCVFMEPSSESRCCASLHGTCLQPDLSAYSAVTCGSGLGKSMTALKILHRILDSCASVLIADADALNLIAENEELAEKFTSSPAARIITPHIGEARRLLHTNDSITGPDSRTAAVSALAEKYHCIAILKGAGTLVTADSSLTSGTSRSAAFEESQGKSMPTEQAGRNSVFCNTTGNPGMATAGSGDSLAGIITSLAAQGYSPLDAARIGVFIHGKAGDLAAEELGEMGMTASDIVRFIPHALQFYYPRARKGRKAPLPGLSE